MKILRKSLLTQLVSSFSLLSLVTVSLVSYTAYTQARESLQASVFDRLNVAVALKDFELTQWFDAQQREALILARSPIVQSSIDALLPAGAKTPGAIATAEELSRYLEIVLEVKPPIQGIDILTNGGIVVLSTAPKQQGVYMGLGNNTTYFEQNQTNVVPNIYISPITGQSTITFATPILDKDGERKAVMAVTLSLDAVNRLIRERTGLGETGETYLVKRLVNQNVFVSGNQKMNTQPPQGVSSAGIDRALRGLSGAELYQNYDGVPVIGVYRWLGKNNVALLAELSQEEAFKPAVDLARDIFMIGVGVAGIMLVLVYLLARQIARPVLVITDAAAAIEADKFETTLLDDVKHRPDELGRLARVFQNMAERIYAREARLKQQVAELKIEIDQARKDLQVLEITETDYFQELARKARDLRQRRE